MSTLTAPTEVMETEDFIRLSEFIGEHYGIQLPLTKKRMIEARLQRRVKALQVATFKDYLQFVFSDAGHQEYVQMIDLITTNKTEFFRESAHFDFLTEALLPTLAKTKREGQPIKIWSAASSTGEEVYTLLITLEEFFFRTFNRVPYHILGTDLSTQVLKKAATAIYDEERIENLPLFIKKRYFLKNKDRENPKARIKPELLQHVAFKRLNLLKPFAGIDNAFDVIFCRNVLIYFNRQTQEEVTRKLIDHLAPGGHLFIGHSESLTNMRLPVVQVRPTVYKKIGS